MAKKPFKLELYDESLTSLSNLLFHLSVLHAAEPAFKEHCDLEYAEVRGVEDDHEDHYAVIHQAVLNFAMLRTAEELFSLLRALEVYFDQLCQDKGHEDVYEELEKLRRTVNNFKQQARRQREEAPDLDPSRAVHFAEEDPLDGDSVSSACKNSGARTFTKDKNFVTCGVCQKTPPFKNAK